jgi:hypothetical protein
VIATDPVLVLPPYDFIPASLNPSKPEIAPPPAPPAGEAAGEPLPFAELPRLEPRLLELLAEARSHHANRKRVFCANTVWYGYSGHWPGLKQRMSQLVGHLAQGDARLRMSQAYDVAYGTIYQALPDCRGRCPLSLPLVGFLLYKGIIPLHHSRSKGKTRHEKRRPSQKGHCRNHAPSRRGIGR